MHFRLALVLIGLSAATACRTETDEAARVEAAGIARQVEVLRNAANPDKPPLRKALEQAACSRPDVCDLKKACADAYLVHEQALAAIASVQDAVSAPGKVPEGASIVLARAEAELGRARNMGKECADKEAALRRHYKL